jgi:RNA polymerase sigma factor (TIGR02999 family)
VATRIYQLIGEAEAGDSAASAELFASLYAELHRLADHQLRRIGSDLSLGTTTLLHEAYLDIAGREGVDFPDRARFMSYASRAMRGLVIDYVRRSRALKRGGGMFEITLAGDSDEPVAGESKAQDLSRLSDALDQLGTLEPSLSELVDLHFFCGYTFKEIADLRGVSERTVQRDWRKARLLLHHDIAETD